jgi:hypothetical protein
MLLHLLSNEDYALALSPGFFQFYAHIGILHALDEAGCLRVSHITGSSAGALVASFLAAGMTPDEMIEAVLKITREDMWDMGGMGGLLKGQKFQEIMETSLPVQTFEECKIPLGVTAYDVLRFKTSCFTANRRGGDAKLLGSQPVGVSIATAVRASCTFPALFQPVLIDGWPHVDGGVWDTVGLMAMQQCMLHSEDSSSSGSKSSSTSGNSDSSSSSDSSNSGSNDDVGSKSSKDSASSDKSVDTGAKSSPRMGAAGRSKLIVNVVFGRSSLSSSKLPASFTSLAGSMVVQESTVTSFPDTAPSPSSSSSSSSSSSWSSSTLSSLSPFDLSSSSPNPLPRLLTIIVENLPLVSPFSMSTAGSDAYRQAREAVSTALKMGCHMQEHSSRHWCCYINAAATATATATTPINTATATVAVDIDATVTTAVNSTKVDAPSSSTSVTIAIDPSPAEAVSAAKGVANSVEMREVEEVEEVGEEAEEGVGRKRKGEDIKGAVVPDEPIDVDGVVDSKSSLGSGNSPEESTQLSKRSKHTGVEGAEWAEQIAMSQDDRSTNSDAEGQGSSSSLPPPPPPPLLSPVRRIPSYSFLHGGTFPLQSNSKSAGR